jgi:hypothetical protein
MPDPSIGKVARSMPVPGLINLFGVSGIFPHFAGFRGRLARWRRRTACPAFRQTINVTRIDTIAPRPPADTRARASNEEASPHLHVV